ncbi:unnamed protein product, partial [Staurois parvus]
ISVTINFLDPTPHPRIWRFPSYLANNQELSRQLKDTWADFQITNTAHVSNPNLFWDAGKAVLRGKIIAFTSAYKKRILHNFTEASNLLRQTQSDMAESNTQKNRK